VCDLWNAQRPVEFTGLNKATCTHLPWFQFERRCLKIYKMVLGDVMNRWKHEFNLNSTEHDRQGTYRVILGHVRIMFMPPSLS
jgi:hypothetical protein